MDPRRPSNGKGSMALLGNGKGNQRLGGRGQAPLTTQRAVGAERGQGQAAGAAALTPNANTQRPERKTMSDLVRHNVQTLQNTVKGNAMVQLSQNAQKEVLDNIISPIMKAHDAGKNRLHDLINLNFICGEMNIW
jgi:hypothetical protein